MQNGTITFGELAEKNHRGETLPAVASFDEATHTIVFQQPTKFLEHPLLETALMVFQAEEKGEPTSLSVTTNHHLLLQRENKEIWDAAGTLHTGDLLVNPYGDAYHFQSAQVTEGAMTVFNLSFSQPATGMHPTYLVSEDGTHWIVAHNILK